MKRYTITFESAREEIVEAESALIADCGALVFVDSDEDPPKLVYAPGTWKRCKLIEESKSQR